MTDSLDAAHAEAGVSTELRSVDAQIALTLDAAVRPRPVRVAISEAQGLLCAEEVVAEHALPGFDQAAVDGYAVRSVDVRTAAQEPVQLPVVGEIPAGSRQPRRLQPGQAVRGLEADQSAAYAQQGEVRLVPNPLGELQPAADDRFRIQLHLASLPVSTHRTITRTW